MLFEPWEKALVSSWLLLASHRMHTLASDTLSPLLSVGDLPRDGTLHHERVQISPTRARIPLLKSRVLFVRGGVAICTVTLLDHRRVGWPPGSASSFCLVWLGGRLMQRGRAVCDAPTPVVV